MPIRDCHKIRVRARLYHIDIPLFADLGLLSDDKKIPVGFADHSSLQS